MALVNDRIHKGSLFVAQVGAAQHDHTGIGLTGVNFRQKVPPRFIGQTQVEDDRIEALQRDAGTRFAQAGRQLEVKTLVNGS